MDWRSIAKSRRAMYIAANAYLLNEYLDER